MSLKLGLRNKIRRSRAGGAVPILLDQSFATGATAAYSLRKLKSSATKAVRVREDASNTEIDIGFSGGTLDTTALLNHCGSANGFVTKWYDQSGNGNDVSNATASGQPQIVNSGSVIQENGQPAIEFDGSDDFLESAYEVEYTQPSTYFVVTKYISGNRIIGAGGPFTSSQRHLFYVNKNAFTPFAGTTNLRTGLLNSDNNLHTFIFDGPNSVWRLNGSQESTGDAGNNSTVGIAMGADGSGQNFGRIKMSELLFYASDQSSNQNNIETNINNHYSIF